MRVLVLGAGGPAGVNTCKALAAHEVVALDENREHLVWAAPHAAETHAAEVTVETVNELRADVVIPQPDNLTLWLADHRDEIEADVFLPDRRVIALCQDKWEASLAFRRAGLRYDWATLIDGTEALDDLLRFPCWLRARHGAGGKAAIKATSLQEARHWTGFWWARDRYMDFITEGVLDGRDLAWSSIWYQGDLVCSFLRERLEYIYPGLTPEGITGTPTIAAIIYDPAVNEVAEAACFAVDEKPHGIYSVDLREDADGVPRPTEINAGRGFTTFGLWVLEADFNLFEYVVYGALKDIGGLRMRKPERDCLQEGLRLYRHIDCGTYIYTPITV